MNNIVYFAILARTENRIKIYELITEQFVFRSKILKFLFYEFAEKNFIG